LPTIFQKLALKKIKAQSERSSRWADGVFYHE